MTSMNRLPREQTGSRREFLRSVGRYGFASVLAGLVFAGARKPEASREKCANRGICGGCSVFASCGLPAALSVKAFRQKSGGTT